VNGIAALSHLHRFELDVLAAAALEQGRARADEHRHKMNPAADRSTDAVIEEAIAKAGLIDGRIQRYTIFDALAFFDHETGRAECAPNPLRPPHYVTGMDPVCGWLPGPDTN